MAAEEYSRRVARIVVAQMAELAGYEAAQESAVEILSELLLKYIAEVCTAAHSYAELAHRTDFNVCDLALALEDMGTAFADLRSYLDSWVAEQGPGAHDQGFVHPLPFEYPVRTAGKNLPTFEEKGEKPPTNVPPWLPAFPDRHTYHHTPLHHGHEEEPAKQHEAVVQLKKQVQRTREAILLPEARAAGAAAPPGERLATAKGNPHLAAPDIELLQPAATALEPLAGPLTNQQQQQQQHGDGDAMAMDIDGDRRDHTLLWRKVEEDVTEQSGAAILSLPPGFSLDLATRVLQQGRSSSTQAQFRDVFKEREAKDKDGNPLKRSYDPKKDPQRMLDKIRGTGGGGTGAVFDADDD